MEKLELEATYYTPKVILDQENGIFEITGKSLPENVAKFYDQILRWFDQYIKSPNPKTVIDLQFEYFNTASAKIITEILQNFEGLPSKGFEVLIRWHYFEESEDIRDAGEDFEAIIELPFEIISFT